VDVKIVDDEQRDLLCSLSARRTDRRRRAARGESGAAARPAGQGVAEADDAGDRVAPA
jgi:hypothetical protein